MAPARHVLDARRSQHSYRSPRRPRDPRQSVPNSGAKQGGMRDRRLGVVAPNSAEVRFDASAAPSVKNWDLLSPAIDMDLTLRGPGLSPLPPHFSAGLFGAFLSCPWLCGRAQAPPCWGRKLLPRVAAYLHALALFIYQKLNVACPPVSKSLRHSPQRATSARKIRRKSLKSWNPRPEMDGPGRGGRRRRDGRRAPCVRAPQTPTRRGPPSALTENHPGSSAASP